MFDEIRVKVAELQAMVETGPSGVPGIVKTFDLWAIIALVMQIAQMIIDQLKPKPIPNP